MSRRIFIMQRNADDTAWETKTISGNGGYISTDANGGLIWGDPEPINWVSSSRISDTDIYSVSASYAIITVAAGSAGTSSLSVYGNAGEESINRVRFEFRNDSGVTKRLTVGNVQYIIADQAGLTGEMIRGARSPDWSSPGDGTVLVWSSSLSV